MHFEPYLARIGSSVASVLSAVNILLTQLPGVVLREHND